MKLIEPMKYHVLYILIPVLFIHMAMQAQRGIRIAYVDTEYILQNVPEYQEASSQLDKKVQEWKSDIDKKLSVVTNKRQELEAERILLTKELYNERLEDIQTEENEVLDYQQKRFGPEGDYITQKNQLVQPIQDQIFATVQEIAETRNYDFIFDKSADLTMLFSAKQYDVSEFVLRSITRSATRKQAQSKSERREAEDEELVPEINTAKEERELALAEKKAARETEIEERRQKQLAEREAAKEAAEARRQQILEDRRKAKEANSGGTPAGKVGEEAKKEDAQSKEASQKSAKELMEEQRAQKLKEREELRQRALQAKQGNNPPSMEEEEKEEPKKEERKTEVAAKKEETTVKSKELSENDKKGSKTENDTIQDNKTPQQLMEEERQKKIKEREEQRQAVLDAGNKQANANKETPAEKTADSIKAEKPLTAQEKIEAERQKKIEEREKRRLELEERKQKILDERKKQKEQQEAEKKTDSTKNKN